MRSIPLVRSTSCILAVALASQLLACATLAGPPQSDIGIVVGQPKLYDDRMLSLVLQAAEANLAGLKFFDQASLAAAIGKFQGGRSDQTATAFSLAAGLNPGVSTVNQATTGSEVGKTLDAQGVATAGTSKATTGSSVQQTVTQPSLTPSIPASPGQTSSFSFQPPFGLSAQDLLTEQENLTFQVANLRMMLERSLSDRIFSGTLKAGDKDLPFSAIRPQTILGFQISIDPQHRFENAVAEVEITVQETKKTLVAPSLVWLMPQSKTYNVATVTKKATSVGLGAVVKVFNVGFSRSGASENLYLVKDTDTIALELPAVLGDKAKPVALRFSWQFRPVLGRKAVEPGTRQVYAVLSLPNSPLEDYQASVEARTCWRRFNPKSGTAGEVLGACSVSTFPDFPILNLPEVEDRMRPKIHAVRWQDSGHGQVVVHVDGENFLPGTSVVLGSTVLDGEATGLFFQGENRLRFVTSGERLAFEHPLLIGRYGEPREFLQPASGVAAEVAQGLGLKIADVNLAAEGVQKTRVTIALRNHKDDGAPLIPTQPIVLIGNRAFGFSDAVVTSVAGTIEKEGQKLDVVKLSFLAPTETLRDARELTVEELFKGPDYVAKAPLEVKDGFSVSSVKVLSSDSHGAQLAISGSGFTNAVEVVADRVKFKVGSDLEALGSTLLTLKLAPEQIKNLKHLVVQQGVAEPIVLALTNPPAPSPKPKVDRVEKIARGDIGTIQVEGANFTSIEKILFDGDLRLDFESSEDGQTLKLRLAEPVTRTAGKKELNLVLKDGTVIQAKLIVEG